MKNSLKIYLIYILHLGIYMSIISISPKFFKIQEKPPSRCVLRKRCSENMQQIYRRTPMPKYDFNKVEISLHLFKTPFIKKTSESLLL